MRNQRGDLGTATEHGLVAELRHRLALAADPERAPQLQAYMKSVMPFRGVDATTVRNICREALAAHRLADEVAWRAAVVDLWDLADYREERYAAIAVTRHRYYRGYQRVTTLDLYRHLVVTGAWWDLVDPIAKHCVGAILRAEPHQVAPIVRSWAADDALWVRRTAILSQLGSKERTDTELLADVLEENLEGSRHGREFFIRKAVGWALREYAKTDEQWVARFVAEHDRALSPLSRREALKHLR